MKTRIKRISTLLITATFIYLQAPVVIAAPSKTFSAFKLLKDGFFEEAVIEYESFRSQFPDEADVHFNLGIAYFKTQRYSSAQLSFERALQLKIEDPEFQSNVEYNIGNALFEQSKLFLADTPERALIYLNESIATFENAVSLQPNFDAAKYNLSVARTLLQEITEDSDPSEELEEDSDKSTSNESSQEEQSDSGSTDTGKNKEQQHPADPEGNPKEAPKKKEQMGSNNFSGDMSLEEAMMLLDAAELDDKRISLSQIQDEKDKKESIINLNW